VDQRDHEGHRGDATCVVQDVSEERMHWPVVNRSDSGLSIDVIRSSASRRTSRVSRPGASGDEDDGRRNEEFTAFVAEHEPRLRRAFVAVYGGYRGREATAEALAYAWEHWNRLSGMENVPGYLYRVGQSRTKDRRAALAFAPVDKGDPVLSPVSNRPSGPCPIDSEQRSFSCTGSNGH
jgi:hypothetical protein